jgi:peroxiredoxin
MRSDDLASLPPDLPVPADDGATDHLKGTVVPAIELVSTDGDRVRLDDREAPRTVVFAYPRTGRPDEDFPGGLNAWNAIPGARGCTPQACAYRDRFDGFEVLGVRVFGLSTQSTDYQREAVHRLHLPYALLSDDTLRFVGALNLPRFEHAGLTLLKRHTLVIDRGRIEHVFYPVFPSDRDAETVLDWLRGEGAPA